MATHSSNENAIDLSGNGAVYLRVSGIKQDDERQDASIRRYIQLRNVAVASDRWYADTGPRDLADQRGAFQRLLIDAERGLFDFILVDSPDRFGAGDKHELFSYTHRLRKAGVKLYTITGLELTSDDMLAVMQTALQQDTSTKEQLTKSQRVLEGKLRRAKLGEWQGGHVPYGFDVACLDPTGEVERWRVGFEGRELLEIKVDETTGKKRRVYAIRRLRTYADGRAERYDGAKGFPATDATDVLQLRPSKSKAAIKVVRDIYAWYADESINFSQIADRLNKLGVAHHYAGKWKHYHVRALLANPAMIGLPTFDKVGQGRFYETDEHGELQQVNRRAKGSRRRKAERWVKPAEQLYPPIISKEIWEAVQKKLEDRPVEARAPKAADLWLAGLLVCGGCGRPMRGYHRTEVADGKRRTIGFEYICSTYADASKDERKKCKCKRHCVRHATIEDYLRRWLDERGHELSKLVSVAGTGKEGPHYESFKSAVIAAADAWWEMQSRTGVTETLDLRKLFGTGKTDTATERNYRAALSNEAAPLEAKKAALEAEHDKLTARLDRIDASNKRALAKANEAIAEIERQLEAVDAAAANVADDWSAAVAECRRLGEIWRGAEKALNSDVGSRQRAGYIRKLVSKIVLDFQATGRRTWRAVELAGIKIEAAVENRSSGASCSPGTSRSERLTPRRARRPVR